MGSDSILTEVISLLTSKFADAQFEGVREAGFSDLSLRQFVYLEIIARLGQPTPSELAKALEVSKPTVTVAIERLEAAGYVRKIPSDTDRRSLRLRLTKKGEMFSKAHANIHRSIARAMTAGLAKAEVAALTALMSKVLRHIKGK